MNTRGFDFYDLAGKGLVGGSGLVLYQSLTKSSLFFSQKILLICRKNAEF